MVKEAIILAGGLGTRLRGIIRDIPKPMAPINNKPFLTFVLDFLNKNRIKKAVLSVGYKKEKIIDYYGEVYKDMELFYSIEKEPLGTGGAVLKALKQISGEKFFLLNGDTLFDVELNKLNEFHKKKKADLTIAMKKLDKRETRYGNILLNDEGRVIGFEEKKGESYLINGGIYIINKSFLLGKELPEKFSFEKDVLQRFFKNSLFYGKSFDSYFIDIGVPSDYERAKKELI